VSELFALDLAMNPGALAGANEQDGCPDVAAPSGESDRLDVAGSLFGVDVANLSSWRSHVWPWLEMICQHRGGHYAAEDLWGFLETGHLQLWVVLSGGAPSGAVLTEICAFPQGQSVAWLFGTCGRGGRDLAGPVLDILAAWAKERGCCQLKVAGNPNWVLGLPGMVVLEAIVGRDL
jgi:hypothetical protein